MSLIAKSANLFPRNRSNLIEQFEPVLRLVGLFFHNRHL